jgi:hypothetical protein
MRRRVDGVRRVLVVVVSPSVWHNGGRVKVLIDVHWVLTESDELVERVRAYGVRRTAAACGVVPQTVCNWLAGGPVPDTACFTMCRLFDALPPRIEFREIGRVADNGQPRFNCVQWTESLRRKSRKSSIVGAK